MCGILSGIIGKRAGKAAAITSRCSRAVVSRGMLGRCSGDAQECSGDAQRMLRGCSRDARGMVRGCSGVRIPCIPTLSPRSTGVLVALSGHALVTLGVWGSLGGWRVTSPGLSPDAEGLWGSPEEPELPEAWSGVFGSSHPGSARVALAALRTRWCPRAGGEPPGWAGSPEGVIAAARCGDKLLELSHPQGDTQGSENSFFLSQSVCDPA